MKHGMLEGAVPAGVPSKPGKPSDKPPRGVPTGVPERWITQIQNGVVALIQRIEADAFVVQAHDLPKIAANQELVSDEQARAIAEAIRWRLE
jgi:hypothetical protein